MTHRVLDHSACGWACCKCRCCALHFGDIRLFVFCLSIVILITGTYQGYTIGIMSSLERRFDLTSWETGWFLAAYDAGHTLTVLTLGYFAGPSRYKPQWTGLGVLGCATAMAGLALPNYLYGPSQENEKIYRSDYVRASVCSANRLDRYQDAPQPRYNGSNDPSCSMNLHTSAYTILVAAQVVMGASSAPFNTLSFVYIDDNADSGRGPFYLGILTSMYALGPAFGFALSALCNHLYDDLSAPPNLFENSPNWIGAWWLGYLICGFLYMAVALPLFCFPSAIRPGCPPFGKDEDMYGGAKHYGIYERSPEGYYQPYYVTLAVKTKKSAKKWFAVFTRFPREICRLFRNPVYLFILVSWIAASFLVGSFGTYLPKYIQHQYHQTPAIADLYTGFISVGAVASSTAIGGYLLTRFQIRPRTALCALSLCWMILLGTYAAGLYLGCDEINLVGKQIAHDRWDFSAQCNEICGCGQIHTFDPVCFQDQVYYSPCHAGCDYQRQTNRWMNCLCAGNLSSVTRGLCPGRCPNFPIYIAVITIGLFLGNLFFMSTMVAVLRSVENDLKSLALSFASFLTNLCGFIPAPVITGLVIDRTCRVRHTKCPQTSACLAYDNAEFRFLYHAGNVIAQGFAVFGAIGALLSTFCHTFPRLDDEDSSEGHYHSEGDGETSGPGSSPGPSMIQKVSESIMREMSGSTSGGGIISRYDDNSDTPSSPATTPAPPPTVITPTQPALAALKEIQLADDEEFGI